MPTLLPPSAGLLACTPNSDLAHFTPRLLACGQHAYGSACSKAHLIPFTLIFEGATCLPCYPHLRACLLVHRPQILLILNCTCWRVASIPMAVHALKLA